MTLLTWIVIVTVWTAVGAVCWITITGLELRYRTANRRLHELRTLIEDGREFDAAAFRPAGLGVPSSEVSIAEPTEVARVS